MTIFPTKDEQMSNKMGVEHQYDIYDLLGFRRKRLIIVIDKHDAPLKDR